MNLCFGVFFGSVIQWLQITDWQQLRWHADIAEVYQNAVSGTFEYPWAVQRSLFDYGPYFSS
jgi:hypothetical protein